MRWVDSAACLILPFMKVVYVDLEVFHIADGDYNF